MEKPRTRRQLGKCSPRLQDNIRISIEEIGVQGVEGDNVLQDRDE